MQHCQAQYRGLRRLGDKASSNGRLGPAEEIESNGMIERIAGLTLSDLQVCPKMSRQAICC